MVDRKEPRSAGILVFNQWEVAGGAQLEEIRQALKFHSGFKQQRNLSGSLSSLPSTMELYQDEEKNSIAFLYPGNGVGKIVVISSCASSPIVQDVLGPQNAEDFAF